MPTFQQALAASVLVFDGAMGTEIYRHHVFTNRSFDELCLSDPKLIQEIHRQYCDAGADVLTTNTFGANRAGAGQVRPGREDRRDQPRRGPAGPRSGPASGPAGVRGRLDRAAAVAAATRRRRGRHDRPAGRGPDGRRRRFHPLRDAAHPPGAGAVRGGHAAVARRALRAVVGRGGAVRIGLGRADRADAGAAARRTARAGRLGNELRQPARTACSAPWRRPCGLCTLPLIVQPNAGMPREVENRRIYFCSPEYLADLRQAVRGPGGVGGGRLLRHHARAHPRDRPGRQAADAGAGRRCRSAAAAAPAAAQKEPAAAGRKIAAGRAGWLAASGSATVELVPPRGYDLSATVAKSKALRERGVDAINIPDGPRASSRISPLITAQRIQQEAGIETILHFCCRDRNLIGMQADLLACAACGIRNLLFITGDPPKLGDYPHATGVFDTDSIGMVAVQRRLNCGIDLGGQAIDPQTFAVIGVGLDPTALDQQRELDRFRQKVDAGAEFAITQPVFDPEALLRFLDEVQQLLGIPILAGIWPLVSYRNASFMRNEVPGVVVPDAVMERMAAVDKPRGPACHGHRDRPGIGGADSLAGRRHSGQRAAGQDRDRRGGDRGLVTPLARPFWIWERTTSLF